ncbi:putative type IV secretory protease [Campylobacter hyointestinalis subsp. hyointestinalis]|uniref:Type IV secretory protease n=1 Tax=Campylobacter hyointestinalis subsp. hyointestinalis TaxID=91352 RepID=A0A0S4SV29_CAMHY|nr:S26 family signal peptidase [Campylobacter hyointestinalis]CUU90031.1 putative type IV secretory protease [Campylobacter hyointestinalis subsp. hyointestinalis]
MSLSKHLLTIELLKKSCEYKYVRTMLIIVFFFIFGYVLSQKYYLGFNFSTSFPEKIFILEKKEVTDKLKNGDIIYALPPKNDYVPDGKMVIKKIVCSPGQILNVVGKDFYCDHNYLFKAKTKDSRGNSIEHFKFNGVIPKDHFFIASFVPNSFDSRYFGLVSRERIKGISIWKN